MRELRYIVSENGTFKKRFIEKKHALEFARLTYIDRKDKFTFVTVDEIELGLYRKYLKLSKNDNFLRDNSKLIREF